MQDQLVRRLEELRQEFTTGQEQLQALERQQANLRQTMLRISGAMQVLEEMLGEPQPGHANSVPSPEPHDGAATP